MNGLTPSLFDNLTRTRPTQSINPTLSNSQDAKRANLDNYLVTVDEIERVTGEKIPVADYAKYDKPGTSWLIPKGCNKG